MMRLIAGLAILLSALAFATDASAHASLVSTEPDDGSVLALTPKIVQLHFNEPVTPAVVGLIDAEGRSRADPAVRSVDKRVIITLPDNLPRGTQIISYRVISADGHPVAGSLVFSIGAATAYAPAPTSTGSVNGLIWLARIGVYLGLFVGVGGVFFESWIAPRRTPANTIAVALIVGVFSAVASLGLQGLDLLDLPLSRIVSPTLWRVAAATSLGPALLIAIVAMAAGLTARRSASTDIARALSAVAMVGVGLSLASSGHAATAEPQWLTRPSVFVHGVGVAFWAGALGPLAVMVWRLTEGLLPVLNRFSRVAVPVVALLVLTGLTLATIQLESFAALIKTKYGIILLIKLALVAALLAFAALNRFRLTPALALDPLNTRPLLRSILVEGVVVLGILAVVAGWRFTPPPRALAADVDAPLVIHIHSDQAMFQVLVSPAKVGDDSFVLQLMNGDGSLLATKEATLTLSLPERGIEPFERNAIRGADGYWHVRDVPMPSAGRWHLRVDALVTDFEKITLEDDFDVAAR
jgi:copper transport protein